MHVHRAVPAAVGALSRLWTRLPPRRLGWALRATHDDSALATPPNPPRSARPRRARLTPGRLGGALRATHDDSALATSPEIPHRCGAASGLRLSSISGGALR